MFGYVYNEKTVGQNPAYNGQWIYVAFCPIDSNISLGAPNGNIHLYNPQYPNVFTNNFRLQNILTYGISDPQGQLVHYKHEAQGISGFVRTCTTSKPDPYNPYNPATGASSGKQRSKFIVSTPQIRMAPSGTYNGYSTFEVVISFPSITNIMMQSGCLISDPSLSCTASGGSTSVTVTVTYTGTGVMTVTYFELQLYATTSGSLGSGGDYTLTINLPQYDTSSSSYMNFGTSLAGTKVTYCTCTSSFKIGNTAYGTSMVFQAPTTTSTQLASKSWYSFNFGSYDYR